MTMKAGTFINELDVRHIGGKRRKLLATFQYRTPSGEHIAAPKGFIYDGQSVPWLLRSLTLADAATARMSCIHDLLTRTSHTLKEWLEADAEIPGLMLAGGHGKTWAWIYWRSCNAGSLWRWIVLKTTGRRLGPTTSKEQ